MASEDHFAEITSSDENAALSVVGTGAADGELKFDLKSDSTEEETTVLTIMNHEGLERTIQVGGGNAQVSIDGNDAIVIEVPEDQTISVDGVELEVIGGQAVSTFPKQEEETPPSETKPTESQPSETISTETKPSETVPTETKPTETKPSETIPTETVPTETKPTESQPTETIPTETRPTETKPTESTPTETKPSETIPTETKPTESQPSETIPTETKPTESTPTESLSTETKPTDSAPTETEPEIVAVKEVTVKPKTLTLGVGVIYQLQPVIKPANATDQGLTYHPSNHKIKVTAKGRITAKRTGQAKLTVQASNGAKAVVNVVVKKAPAKITLNVKQKVLKPGKTFQIKVKLPKNTASNKLTFTSNRKSVAIVSPSGKVTAKKSGVATITVKTFNKKTAKLKITVKKK